MDPITIGLAVCYALWHMGKAVKTAAAKGSQAAAARSDKATGAMRSHPNRAVRAAGHALHGWNKAGGAIDGALRTGAGAAKDGLKAGWEAGRQRGEERATMTPEERRADKLERRRARDARKRDRFDAAVARRKARQEDRLRRLGGGTVAVTDGDTPGTADPDAAPTSDTPEPAVKPETVAGEERPGPTLEPLDPDEQRGHDDGAWAAWEEERNPPTPARGFPSIPPLPATPDSRSERGSAMPEPMPTGEIQGKADTERALAAYRGAATTFADDLAVSHATAQDLVRRVNAVADQLSASELGARTMAAVGAVQDETRKHASITENFGPAVEAMLAAIAEFETAVAAHDAVEAAALANQDGGSTAYHAA